MLCLSRASTSDPSVHKYRPTTSIWAKLRRQGSPGLRRGVLRSICAGPSGVLRSTNIQISRGPRPPEDPTRSKAAYKLGALRFLDIIKAGNSSSKVKNQSWGAWLPVCRDGTEAGWLHAPPPYGREEARIQLVWFAWVVIGAVINVSWFLVIFNFFFILSCMTFQYIQLLCKPVPGEQDPVSSFLFWMMQILPHTYSSPIYSR